MIKFSPKDKKLTWEFVVSRKFSPFYDYIFNTSSGRGNFPAIFNYKHSYRRIIIDSKDIFYCKKDIAEEKNKQLKQIKNNFKLAAQRVIQAEKEGGNLMKLSYNIRNKNFDKLTNEQIKNLLMRFLEKFYRISPFLMMPLAIESYLEKELDKYLIQKFKNNKNKIQDIKSIVLVPSKDNLQIKEQLSIFKLAEEFKRKKKITDNLKKKIKAHADKFGMLGLRYGIGDIWNAKDVMERIGLLSKSNPKEEYNKLIQSKKENKEQLEKIIQELGLNEYIKEVIKVIQNYIFLRTYRTNIMSNSLTVIKPFLERVSERLNIKWNILNYMILPEVLDSLNSRAVSKKTLEETKKRKKGFGSIFINDQYHIFTGKDMEKIAKLFNLKPKIKKQDIVNGVIASPGKIKGIVRILYSSQDNKKVKRGDILVASMTTPNFVPAMEQAGAFVTDEGGILCHAAIVSREMNKPCIIGTKIATQVLKDGQLVEVDANKGFVKILKSK